MTTGSAYMWTPETAASPFPLSSLLIVSGSLSESAVKVHVFGSLHQGLWTTTINTHIILLSNRPSACVYSCICACACSPFLPSVFVVHIFPLDGLCTCELPHWPVDSAANTFKDNRCQCKHTHTHITLITCSISSKWLSRGDLKTLVGAEERLQVVRNEKSRGEEIKPLMQMDKLVVLKCKQVIWLLCQDTARLFILEYFPGLVS